MAWYDKWAIMTIAAAIGVGGYYGIPWCKMDVTIWAYWVAAIGTTGTLIGTIWLATEEKRERSRRELDLALVVCGGIILKITEIQVKMKAVGETLLLTVPGERENIEWSAGILSTLPEIEFSDLAALIVLPDNVATKVATFLTELDWCKKEITKRSISEEVDDDIAHMCIQTGKRMLASSERLFAYKAAVQDFLSHNKCEIV